MKKVFPDFWAINLQSFEFRYKYICTDNEGFKFHIEFRYPNFGVEIRRLCTLCECQNKFYIEFFYIDLGTKFANFDATFYRHFVRTNLSGERMF